jgi:hypothetical protein
MDREKVRTVTIPIQTYKSVKMASARELKPMCNLLAGAWSNYEQKVAEVK